MVGTTLNRRRIAKWLVCLLVFLFVGFAANAAESSGLEEETALEFEDTEASELEFEDSDDEKSAESSLLSQILDPARFTVRHELSYKTENPAGIKSNRSSFRLEYSRFFYDHFYIQFDSKLSAFWANDHRAEAEDDDVLYETSSREVFLQISVADTSVKVGNQVMIWGESDGGAITDVISPRDYSELFFISLEESRIGQPMLAVDQFSSVGQWTLFYIPDADFNAYPEEGTAYYVDLFEGRAFYQDEKENEDLPEYGLRWKKTFGKSDISIMAANLIDNDYAYRLEGYTGSGKLLFSRIRQRYHMMGTAFNYVTGSFLFKGEIGRKSSRAFNVSNYQIVEKSVLDTALGLEYSPGGTYSLGFEAVNSHIEDWSDDILGIPEDSYSIVFVWSQTFLNEDLSVDWMTQYTAPYVAYVHSLRTSYKWNDDVTFYLEGYLPDVQDEDNDLWVYRDQKQVVIKAQYQF